MIRRILVVERVVCFITLMLLSTGVCWPRRAPSQGLSPQAAEEKLTTPEGLKGALFASEPEVRQPILVKCDDRGRVWTIQYLQYPNPAGLKRVKIDRWSRTVYDKFPDPPPKGPVGADKITILQDTDGDGRADTFRDFVTGLNLCTGIEFGHDGVYVLQVPYLLFYPDRDHDDHPDGDPEVLLSGFGMEDAQSFSNHLTLGPDGWLYGVNGSTTTCNIRGIEFQQGCWRYHPRTKEFELFCEGGGNTFGLTFDALGNLFYSTNGGPFVHAVQGGYYYKSFGKHGPLHNRHTHGFFTETEKDAPSGGPPTGGTVYLADAFPEKYHGAFISGNFLGHTIYAWNLVPKGNSFAASFNGVVLDSHDPWFGPTDVCLAPDGSMYCCDFYDQRTGHPDPDAKWDLTNGRIYKVSATAAKRPEKIDVAALSDQQLCELLTHENRWFANRARVHLAGRMSKSVLPALRKMALQSAGPERALQGLWGLNASGELDEEISLQLLAHPSEHVRAWTIRLWGDQKNVPEKIAAAFLELSRNDPSVIVRTQLTATAKRLPGPIALPIALQIARRNLDSQDPRLPLLLWWCVESKAISDRDQILEEFANLDWTKEGICRQLLWHLIRRYAAEGTAAGYDAAARLLELVDPTHPADAAPQEALEALAQGLADRNTRVGGVEQGGLFQRFAALDEETDSPDERLAEGVSGPLANYLREHWLKSQDDPSFLRLAVRGEVREAEEHLFKLIHDSQADDMRLVSYLIILPETSRHDYAEDLLRFLDATNPEPAILAAVAALRRFNAPDVARRMLETFPSASPSVQASLVNTMLANPQWARILLNEVETGTISPKLVTVDQLRVVSLHEQEDLNEIVRRHWGNIGKGTSEEKLATMRRFANDLRARPGTPAAGKPLFVKHCGKCHQLFGEGNKVGPDLTPANRNDQDALLANIVDPNSVIRREYMNFIVETTSGQIETGIIAERDASSITLLDAKNERRKIPLSEIDVLREADVSLMPEKLLEPLTPDELRDLFSFLRLEKPLP